MNRTLDGKQFLELSKLNLGISATVIEVNFDDKEIRRKIFDMGFTVSAQVSIIKKSPFGDSVVVKI